MTLRHFVATGLILILVASCKTTDLSHGATAKIFTNEQERQILAAYMTGNIAQLPDMAGGALFDQHPLGALKPEYPEATGKFVSYGLVSTSKGTFRSRQMTASAPMIVRTFALRTEKHRTLFVRFYIGVDNGVNRLMKLEPDLDMIKQE